MCKMALGIKRFCPDGSARAELGSYPIMSNIIKRIFSYWHHIQNASPKSILSQAINASLKQGSASHYSFVPRISDLSSELDADLDQTLSLSNTPDTYSRQFQHVFNTKFEIGFFNKLSPSGRTELYEKIKKVYRFEPYLNYNLNNKLRRLITQIRLYCHCLPVEYLRRKGVPRQNRICTLCDKAIGSEFHVLAECQSLDIVNLRRELIVQLLKLNSQFSALSQHSIIKYLLLASDQECCYYFCIFLKKTFRLVTSKYSK